jgi:regulator of protease activity HflC (stomatin/prohibitin superfamily)
MTFLIYLFGFTNPETKEGYAGYLMQCEVFGKCRFVRVMHGPTKAGIGYLQKVINVSVTPYTYEETFTTGTDKAGNPFDEATVALDKLKMQTTAQIQLKLKPDDASVKLFVETYGVTDDGLTSDEIAWLSYKNVIQPVLRTYIREEEEKWKGLDLQNHLGEIGQNVLARLKDYTEHMPFIIESVTMGMIAPPAEVLAAINNTQGKRQDLLRKKQDKEIALLVKKQRKEEALGIEEGMRKLKGQLTDEYLTLEMSKVLREMTKAPNHEVFFIPQGMTVTGTMPMSSNRNQ